MVDLRRVALLAALTCAALGGACIIGPKQDDPVAGTVSPAADSSVEETGFEYGDTSTASGSDSGDWKPMDASGGDAPPPTDAAADAAGDASSDAPAEDADAASDADAGTDATEGG